MVCIFGTVNREAAGAGIHVQKRFPGPDFPNLFYSILRCVDMVLKIASLGKLRSLGFGGNLSFSSLFMLKHRRFGGLPYKRSMMAGA